jgi:hypothetical protein
MISVPRLQGDKLVLPLVLCVGRSASQSAIPGADASLRDW